MTLNVSCKGGGGGEALALLAPCYLHPYKLVILSVSFFITQPHAQSECKPTPWRQRPRAARAPLIGGCGHASGVIMKRGEKWDCASMRIRSS